MNHGRVETEGRMKGRLDGGAVAYGVFKGMGDLLAAAPVIASLLRAGEKVILLVFPQTAHFVDLLDLGAERNRLRIIEIASGLNVTAMWKFFREARRVSPSLIWLSPHTPAAARSWRIPFSIWLTKKLCWRSATLGGADSERLSWLFDCRVPVDRRLPFAQRERVAFAAFCGRLEEPLPEVSFKKALMAERSGDPEYDLLIFPGAVAENRKWPLIHYAELLRRLPLDWMVGICAIAEDAAALRGAIQERSNVVLLEVPLIEAIRRMTRSRVVFCMDSGPMFFARALGVPVVAMFGASDPVNVISNDRLVRPIYRKRWSCQPCGNSRCIQREPYCISSISPSDVLAEIYETLGLDGAA